MWRKWCDNKKIYTYTNIRYVCQSLCVDECECVYKFMALAWPKKVQRKRSKAPRDIINEGSATSGGSSQNNNCRQFGGPRNCLFVKHFSLFDMSTSSSDRPQPHSDELNWKTIETRAKFSFFLSRLSFLVSCFWRLFFRDLSKWATNWDGLDFWDMSEKCYRCFCHVGLKLKSPINGRSVMSGPLIYYYPSLAAC